MTTKTLSLVTATLLLTTNIYAEETLQDITVTTATKTTQFSKELTANISVITQDQIEDRGYTTVTQALNSLPGVSYTRNGGLGATTFVRLRGMDSKRTLVLIDGIRYNDVTSNSGAAFAHLMVQDIAQIEVLKGAQSGVWGADASAGVINIITKKASAGVHGSFFAEKGSYNTNKYGITLSWATQNYDFKVSHNVVDTDGFSAQAPVGTKVDSLEDDGYKNKTTSLSLGYNINETNKITLAHTIIDANGEYDTFGDPESKAFTSTKDTFSSVNFKHIDSFNELNVYAKLSKFDREFVAPDFSGVVTTSPFDGEVKEYGFTSKVPYNTKDFVLVGADYKKFEHQNTLDKDYTNKGFFITNTNTFEGLLAGETILTESLRYDTYSTFDNKLTGKIGLKHIHAGVEGLSTSLNYGTSYNVPTLYQLYSQYGNPATDTETTKSFDVTIDYKDFIVTYFDTKIDDMIDFDTTTYKYANIAGTSKISGIEVAYKTNISDAFLLSANYTHLLKAQNQDGVDLLRRSKDTVKVALDYYGVEKLHLGIDAEYVGSRNDVKFNPDFSTTDVQTGKYTLVNLTADYDITTDVKVYAKIENLTDETYQTVYGYASSARAFYAGLRAKF